MGPITASIASRLTRGGIGARRSINVALLSSAMTKGRGAAGVPPVIPAGAHGATNIATLDDPQPARVTTATPTRNIYQGPSAGRTVWPSLADIGPAVRWANITDLAKSEFNPV